MRRTYVGAAERGEKNIRLAMLERLERGLGISVVQIIEEADRWMGHGPVQ